MHLKTLAPLLIGLLAMPTYADEPKEKDDGLIEVMASQDLSVRRGEDKAVKESGIHPKSVKQRERHKLDRFAMIRFDSEDLGKGVRAAGLRLQPVNFSDSNKAMRFRVYGVNDGDEQDEKFTEKTYDPNDEKSIVDRRLSTMLDRDQVAILGTFTTDKDEAVLFTTRNLLAFLRADTNGTATLVIVRQTDSGHNSTFATRQQDNGPRLVMKLEEKEEEKEPVDSDEAEADEEREQEAEAEAEDAPAE